MTLHTPARPPHLPQSLAHTDSDSADRPTYIFEALLAGPVSQPITVPGWTVRTWPVARLGDATLEVRADGLRDSLADLHAALRDAGISALGPVRARHH